MRQPNWTWNLLGCILLCLVAGCESTYAYLPSTSKTVPAPASGPAAVEEPAPGPAAVRPQEPQAGLGQQVQALQERVQRLEGQVAEMEARKGYPPPSREAVAPARAQEKAAPQVAKASPAMDKTYEEGLRLYKSKKYGAAREKFNQYLKAQPQGPRAGDARFYLADSFYLEGHYKDAAAEFQKVVAQHPQSVLAPAALLRQAYSYQKMRQTQNYQNALKQLVQNYPKSPEAKAAKEQLKSR